MLTIWRFTDGKRGHENQTLGLVEALCRLTPCTVETLTVSKGWPYIWHWLAARFVEGKSLPKPDLIIGAGHASHWPMLAARRAHGGKIAVLMKPSLPLAWFDWVIAPEHDFPSHPHPNPPPSRGRGNILLTSGPINRIRPGQPDTQAGLMLIGGPSSEYGWSETALLKQIHLIALRQPEVTWHLTTSRRTPTGFLDDLGKLGLPNLKAVAHDKVRTDWLPANLSQASQVWVTPDSASMVYEALTSGAAVGCFELPFLKPGRVARGLEKLVRDNRLTAFSDWQATGKLKPNIQPLNEAERCAKELLQWLAVTPSPLTGEGWGRDGEFVEHAPRMSSGSGVQAGTRPARGGEDRKQVEAFTLPLAPPLKGGGVKFWQSPQDVRETCPDRKLTVLQVLPALQSGGVERGTLEIGKHLVEHGHRSLVISAGGRLEEQLQREGSEHFTWDIGKKSLWTLHLIPRLRHFLIENKVDILHARSRMPAWICFLAWKGMDPKTRPRFITTVHGLYSVNPYSAVMTKGEHVIAVSETVRDYVLQNYPNVPRERIVIIPRGIAPDEYPHGHRPAPEWLSAWHAQYPQLAGKKVLTLPGRITRLKGHEDFIKLIAQLKKQGEPVHGLIVGGASAKKQRYLNELKNKIKESGLTQDITFTGQRDDLREIMAASDLVLSLSTQPESFGRTVLEALSMGVPVIGYDHGGVGEQLRRLYPQGQVPLGDIDALVRKCRDIQTAARIGLQAPPTTLKDMLAGTLDLYEKILPPI